MKKIVIGLCLLTYGAMVRCEAMSFEKKEKNEIEVVWQAQQKEQEEREKELQQVRRDGWKCGWSVGKSYWLNRAQREGFAAVVAAGVIGSVVWTAGKFAGSLLRN